jgi:hypothetical protein
MSYMRMAIEMLAEVHEISKHHFNARCFTQTYDSAHISDSLEEGLDQVCSSGSSIASTDNEEVKPRPGWTGSRTQICPGCTTCR